MASPQSSNDGGIGNAPRRRTSTLLRAANAFARRMAAWCATAQPKRYATAATVPAWHQRARVTPKPHFLIAGRKINPTRRRLINTATHQRNGYLAAFVSSQAAKVPTVNQIHVRQALRRLVLRSAEFD